MGMVSYYKALFDLYRQGKEVADPATWKNRHRKTGALVLFLTAVITVARGMGYDIHISPDDLNAIGAGVVAVYAAASEVLIVVTSKKVGATPKD